MSVVKRYTPEPYDGAEMVVQPDGWYVNASDFDALKSQNGELVSALEALLAAVEGTAGGHLAADVLEGTVASNARLALSRERGAV